MDKLEPTIKAHVPFRGVVHSAMAVQGLKFGPMED